MGKITQFEMFFKDNQEIFTPGEIVNGSISLTLNDAMEMRKIKVECEGKANVHWTETRTTSNGKTTTTHTDHYRSSEKYFEYDIVVAGKGTQGNTADKMTLPAGNHVYYFSFQLPANLPSSFESRIGRVRYHVKAKIDRPWKFDHTLKRMFTVLDVLDLNQEPNARMPSGRNDAKYLCCCCCKSGPIEADVHTDKTGYVAGEMIIVNAKLENHSNSKVQGTLGYIKQETRFITPRKTKTQTATIAQIPQKSGCGRKSTVNWTNERIMIPAIPPSEMRNCKIIDINYYFVFEAQLRTCAVNLRVNCPITIGTIPLAGTMPSMPEPPVMGIDNPPMPSAPVMPAPSAPELPPYTPPPPSYKAAIGAEPVDVHEEGDNEHMMGQTTYTPQYSYYDWSQSAFSYNK